MQVHISPLLLTNPFVTQRMHRLSTNRRLSGHRPADYLLLLTGFSEN